MPISMRCPNAECGKASRLPDNARGRWARCPSCGHKFQVPAEAPDAKSTQGPVLADTLPTTPPGRKPAPSTRTTLPARIGRFVIKEKLGAGAFGAVYRAHDPQLGREVALKVPHPGALSEPRLVERFLREGRAAAGLHHPHIVPVFDAGQDGPHHYLAAAFIPGRSLAHEVAAGPLEFRRAAELVRQLAEAVAYAHGQGIVHRDIKPANVLLDEQGETHLADFGLAHRADEGGELTREGAVMGTPAYMAPEQAEGQKGKPLPASDQYSLGAVLYELLTGEAPFSGPPAIVLYNVIHQEPEPPRKLNPDTPPELEAVCLKAMAKRPEQRYTDCGELADDLRHWLESEPVLAQPLGMAGRCLRWLRREPKLAALTGVTVVCLLIAAGVATGMAQTLRNKKTKTAELATKAAAEERRAADERGKAEEQNKAAQRAAAQGAKAVKEAQQQRTAAKTAATQQREQARKARDAERDTKNQEREARLKLYRAHLAIARTAFARKDSERTRASLARHFPEPGQPDVRDAAWHDLWIKLPKALTAPDHLANLSCVALRPDEGLRVSGSTDQTVRVWDEEGKKALFVFTDHPGTITALAFAPRGRVLASAAADRSVRLWEVPTGAHRVTLGGITAPVTALAFNSQGDRLAGAASGDRVVLWRGADRLLGSDGTSVYLSWTPTPLEGKPGLVGGLAFSPDGLELAAGSDREVWLWDVATGRRRGTLSGQKQAVTCVAFSPDGRKVAGGSADGTVTLWDVASGKVLASVGGQAGPVSVVTFTPDGRTLTAGGADDKVWFWDVASGKELGRVTVAGPGTRALTFGRDGLSMTALSRDLKRQTIPLHAARLRLVLTGDGRVTCLASSPDGKTLAAGRFGEGKVHLHDLRRRKQVAVFKVKTKGVAALAFSPDGRTLAVSSDDVQLWDVGTGKKRLTISCRTGILAFSPDGKTLAAGESYGDRVRLWDPVTGKEKRSLRAGFGTRLVFSPDGQTLATSNIDGVKVWDVTTGQEKHAQAGVRIDRVAFSPDGKALAVASGDEVSWWDLASGRRRRVLSRVNASQLRFSPDLTLAVTGTPDFGLKGDRIPQRVEDWVWGIELWDLTTGKMRGTDKRVHTGGIAALGFSPDGRSLISAGEAGPGDSARGSTIKVWDVRPLPDFDKR